MAEATYHVETWSGLSLMVCLVCSHNEFDMDRMTTHLHDIHGLTPLASSEEPPQDEGEIIEYPADAVTNAEGTLT